jgi:hypothetical protein
MLNVDSRLSLKFRRSSMKARKWLMEYGVAMILAVVCAVVLGHLSLFREAAVGKLHASDLVQFIGYGGAIVLAWFGARQLAEEPPEDWKWLLPYRGLILPVTTLVLVGSAYEVLLYAADRSWQNPAGKSITGSSW